MHRKVHKQTPDAVPVVIEVITENTAKPVKEVKHVKEIEAKPVKEVKPVDKVPVIRTKIKPRTPYTAYISKNFKEYHGKGKSNGEIFKDLAKAWGGMSPEQKAGYKV